MCDFSKKSVDQTGGRTFCYPIRERVRGRNVRKINRLGIGPGGLGGTTTALAVNVNTYATHIAGLPVAVNICCHVNRHVVREV